MIVKHSHDYSKYCCKLFKQITFDLYLCGRNKHFGIMLFYITG